MGKKGFKGFKKGMVCSGINWHTGQPYSKTYVENATNTIEGDLKACENGIHFCEHPLDVFAFYPPSMDNVYCEVEAMGDVIDGNGKSVTNKLYIGNKMSLTEYIEYAAEYMIDNSIHAESNPGYYSASSSKKYHSVLTNTGLHSVASGAGYYSVVYCTGVRSVSSNAGYYSISSNRGFGSVSSNTGDYSISSNVGFRSISSNTGDHSFAYTEDIGSISANTGPVSVSSTVGDKSIAVVTGRDSTAVVSGEYSIAVAAGYKSKAKASKGGYLVIYEYINHGEIKDVHFAKVDGEKIKADTYYTIKNGEFVEAED